MWCIEFVALCVGIGNQALIRPQVGLEGRKKVIYLYIINLICALRRLPCNLYRMQYYSIYSLRLGRLGASRISAESPPPPMRVILGLASRLVCL